MNTVTQVQGIDAFPVIRHDSDLVHTHLVDYLSQPGVKLPPGMDIGVSAGGLAKGLFTRTMSGQIEGMARKFIAGEDAATALPMLAAPVKVKPPAFLLHAPPAPSMTFLTATYSGRDSW